MVGGSVGTYWAWALAWSALDLAQVLDTVLDADARHQVVKRVAGVVCRIVLSGRVVARAVRDVGAVGERDTDGLVDALVDGDEALRVHGREVVGDVLDRADDGVVAVGADWDYPFEVDYGVVGQGIIELVAVRSLVTRRSVPTFHHDMR